MLYQYHLTKYCILRPLTSKRAAEVAYQLMDIFLMFGAPHILQSDNGSEFTAAVITELKLLWTDLLIVHGKPRHPQSQGSVERLNCDVKDMLIAWLGDNKTTDWAVGRFKVCPILQKYKLPFRHQTNTLRSIVWRKTKNWIPFISSAS